jgi:hypothetical protein
MMLLCRVSVNIFDLDTSYLQAVFPKALPVYRDNRDWHSLHNYVCLDFQDFYPRDFTYVFDTDTFMYLAYTYLKLR